MTPPPRPSSPDVNRGEFPQHFGRYVILGRIGTGGMADALLAMLQGDHGFQKPVVIKRMHSSLGHDSHFVKMFLDEARLAARLNHANVVATSEVGECDGHYFIAMEYLEGLSLDRIARGYIQNGSDIPLGLLVRVLVDCLDGLHYAHTLKDYDGTDLKVVHRDVTPSNLFVTFNGISKVLDFGIAKATSQDEATRTGMLKGKLAYMAPEQFYDTPIDHRSDVWAMGVVLWEMVTGRRLFKGPNDAITYRNIMATNVPPLRTYRNDAPTELDAVIARALARDRDQRYASADAMRRDLDAVLRSTLSGTSHGDVATEMVSRFGAALEENRRVIREYSQKRAPVAPRMATIPARGAPPIARDAVARAFDDDENPTHVNRRDDVPATFAPAAAHVPRPRVKLGPPEPPEVEGTDRDDDPDAATVIDAKDPEIAAIVAVLPPRVSTLPEVRPSVAPVMVSAPAAPIFDAVSDAPVQDARRHSPWLQALGWLTLFALLSALGTLAWSQRDFIERGVQELVRGTPPDPARVGTFVLRLSSDPPGAIVTEGTTVLGPTPIELPVLRASVADQPRAFTFQRQGYVAHTAAQGTTLAARAELHVTLVPVDARP